MACLTADEKTRLEAKRDKYILIITSIEDALEAGAVSGYIGSYEIDTGAGKQKVSYRNLSEIQRALSLFESKLARIYTILEGKGVVDATMHRRRC
jgi:hypothetical protein